MENELMFQAKREDNGNLITGYFTRKKIGGFIYPVIEVEKNLDGGDFIESHIIDGNTLKKISAKPLMIETYYVLFKRSMLYDENHNECLAYYVEDSVFSNGIKNAHFFKDKDEAREVLKQYEEATIQDINVYLFRPSIITSSFF
jgi:hypothetical protein